MNKLFALCSFLLLICSRVVAQDIPGLIDKSPAVASTLLQALEHSPSFSSKVQITFTSKAERAPNTASGTFDYASGNLRLEANLSDVSSERLTTQARAAVRQINGDHLLLITRADTMTAYVVLARAQSCLAQPMPVAKLSSRRIVAAKEALDGKVCRKEKAIGSLADGSTNQVTWWTAREMKGPPVQLEISDGDDVLRIRFVEAKPQPVPMGRFRIPEGLATYTTFEDLIQSVLLDRLKRRMGLDQ